MTNSFGKMETHLAYNGDREKLKLPPGFRFHPTDEELITHYLCPKVLDSNFYAKAIGEVDFNKVEPWDLPWKAKMGEREFYFFCVRDRKYPTGSRTNRATDAGYWKATGKDKEIYKNKILVGMKKTLVFYTGRAPKGEKTNWVMHEYRLECQNNSPATPPRNEWVISRIFLKSSDGKKIHISNMATTRNYNNQPNHSNLPQLIKSPNYDHQISPITVDHMGCFSGPTMENKPQKEIADSYNDSFLCPKYPILDPLAPNSYIPNYQNLQTKYCGSSHMDLTPISKVENGYDLITGPINLDCLWNY